MRAGLGKTGTGEGGGVGLGTGDWRGGERALELGRGWVPRQVRPGAVEAAGGWESGQAGRGCGSEGERFSGGSGEGEPEVSEGVRAGL